MCPATDDATRLAPVANADDVADNALRDPARDVTPSGTPHCKNAGSIARARPRTWRNNPAGRTSVPQNLRSHVLGADPRASPPRQRSTAPVPADVVDNADSADDDAPDRPHWPDNAGSPSPVANAAPPQRIRRCNSDSAGETVETNAHNPSANNDGFDASAHTLARAN